VEEFLSQQGVTFRGLNVDVDPGAMDQFRVLGIRSVPTVVIGSMEKPEAILSGFDRRRLAAALSLAPQPRLVRAAVLLPLIGRVLDAAARAVRQMPDAILDWEAPDRPRPMREFAPHIFAVAQAWWQQIDGRPIQYRLGDEPHFDSFTQVARWATPLVEEYVLWAARQDAEELERRPIAEERTAADVLDLMAGHSIQHLRQVCFVLRANGIEPLDPIPDEDLPAEYVLTILW
jgi:hypothetical protein